MRKITHQCRNATFWILALAAAGAHPVRSEIRSWIGLAIPQHGGGAALTANLYAPDLARQGAPFPVISMLPGGGAPLSSVEWAAQRLARDGYIVCLTRPERSSEEEYSVAAISGIDFLSSPQNPVAAQALVSQVGVCGWSLGGRSLVLTQEVDERVKCLVAWDNLAVSEKGDGGSPLGSNRPQPFRRPRVPAMGQASLNGLTPSDAKLAAWKWWRQHDIPAFQVVFANSNHFWWSGTSSASSDTRRDQSHHYTLAWFDRWLKGDPGATARLLAPTIATPSGTVTSDALLSTEFRSAAYVDGVDTADLRARLGSAAPAVPGGRPAQWVCSAGSSATNEVARALDTDARGDLYTVGSFASTVAFAGPLGNGQSLSSVGAEDAFVVKTAPDGTVLWSRAFGGPGSDFAYDVSVDPAGRIFVTGTFQGSWSAGGFALSTAAGTTSTYSLEIDPTGKVVWAGATGEAQAGSVLASECVPDEAGGWWVAGSFTGTARFGQQTLVSGTGELRPFIARYSTDRTCTWVSTGSASSCAVRGLAVSRDGSGDLLATGQFSGAATLGAASLISAGSSDIWLARLDGKTGVWKWARTAGGAGEDYGRGVVATASGYAVSGVISGAALPFFGHTGPAAPPGGRDVYVARFNWADQMQWSQALGGPGDDEGAEISAFADESVVVCGSFAGTMRFAGHTQTSGGARDLLIAAIGPDGSARWIAGSAGGGGDDVGFAVATDTAGRTYFAGFFSAIAAFGYDVALSPVRESAPNQQDIVFGMISPASEPRSSETAALVNLSTRASVGAGDRVLISGFVLQGSSRKRLLIRAVGPKLTDFGITGTLADPTVELRDAAGQRVAGNDNWASESPDSGLAAAMARVGAFPLTNAAGGVNDLTSAALSMTLNPGAYTAVVRGARDLAGIALLEVYDDGAVAEGGTRLTNLSTRGVVGLGPEVMIPGLVVRSASPRRFLIRAVGPKLADFGLAAGTLLADPIVRVQATGGGVVATSDNWTEGAQAAEIIAVQASVGAFPLVADPGRPGSVDDRTSAAVVVSLATGAYTVLVSGTANGTGVALCEVYEVPGPAAP